MQYFQTAYSAAVAAFNTAMGDMSQGISSVDPMNPKKTATEMAKALNNKIRGTKTIKHSYRRPYKI